MRAHKAYEYNAGGFQSFAHVPGHVWERWGERNEHPDVAWIEASWMTKHAGRYHLQYSGCDNTPSGPTHNRASRANSNPLATSRPPNSSLNSAMVYADSGAKKNAFHAATISRNAITSWSLKRAQQR